MRTLQQIKDDVALANDYKHWEDVIDNHMELEYIDQCMYEAQKEAISQFQTYLIENPINAACLIIQNEMKKDYEKSNYNNSINT